MIDPFSKSLGGWQALNHNPTLEKATLSGSFCGGLFREYSETLTQRRRHADAGRFWRC
jgi:hypothetical protein